VRQGDAHLVTLTIQRSGGGYGVSALKNKGLHRGKSVFAERSRFPPASIRSVVISFRPQQSVLASLHGFGGALGGTSAKGRLRRHASCLGQWPAAGNASVFSIAMPCVVCDVRQVDALRGPDNP